MSTLLLFGNSTTRDASLYPSGNSYTLFLSSPVRNIERVDLVSARVPNTMYNLTNGTGSIIIGLTTVDLNPGFYGVYDMATALTNTGLVTCTYLPFEGKFLFTSAVSFTLQVKSSQLSNILGLAYNTTLSSAAAGSTWPAYSGQQIIVSTRVVDTHTSEHVFLDIDELKTPSHVFTGGLNYVNNQRGSVNYSVGSVSGTNTQRAFAPILLDVNSGCVKNFAENSDYKISVFYPEPINSIDRLTVRWLDKNGVPLIFNGLETNSFLLRLHLKEPPKEPTEEENNLERRVTELEIMRMVADAKALEASKPPPPVKKTKFGKWTVVLLALLGIVGYIIYKRFLVPNEGPP